MPPEERPVSSGRTSARRAGPGPSGPLPADAAARFAAHLRALANLRSTHSNNWAMAGTHTANGRSLLAGDPHQPLRSPSLFFAHHVSSLQAGGNLDVIGFFSMVDRRKRLHRELLVELRAARPDLLDELIPAVTDVERMGVHRQPVAAFSPGSRAARSYAALWDEISARL